MLYNVVFGNQNIVSDEWRKLYDRKYVFFEKPDIGQRIRLDESIAEKSNIELVWKTNQIQCYDFGTEIRWKTNTTNMNGIMRPVIQRRDGSEPSEQIIVYITLMNNYQMMEFTTNYQILMTYHKTGVYQGCVVILSKDELESVKDPNLITIKAYNRKKEVPCMLTVTFNRDKVTKQLDPHHINTSSAKVISNPSEATSIKAHADAFQGEYLGFKMVLHPGTLLTSVYFVTPEYEALMHKVVHYQNKRIVVIDPKKMDTADTRQLISYTIQESHARAITQVGLELPLEEIQKNRIIYVFNYSPKTKLLTCIKSN